MKKNKLINLLKKGILLFGISLLLWNCNKENNLEPLIQSNTEKYQEISKKEVLAFLSNQKKENFKRKGNSLQINTNDLKFIKVQNSDLSIPVISASLNPNVTSNLFLLKENNQIKSFLYHQIPKENNTSNLFSGKIIITTINQEFINGYKIKNGVFVARYVKQKNRYAAKQTLDPDPSDCIDYGTDFCNNTLDEVSIGGGGGSGGSFSIFIFPPRGGNIRFSNTNSSGSSTGGGGVNNSNNNGGNSQPAFPCGDSLHGCQKTPCPDGNGYQDYYGNCVEEDQIINLLTGKAKCVYDKMVDSNNSINWILNNFKDNNKPSQFNLKFVMGTFTNPKTNASTSKSGNIFTIKINKNTLSGRTSLGLARTIIHEGIHARLREFASREGSNATSFPGVYDYFRIYKKNWDHQQMADFYRTTIANGLKQFDKGNHSGQFYRDMAWEGLANIVDANNKPNQIYTEAWKKLTPTEQNRIKNTIANEKNNGNKTCQ